MKHARSDYDRIQDPEGLIPDDEFVYLLRSQDLLAPATVEFHAQQMERMGADARMVLSARRHAQNMRAQQQTRGGGKVPDAPAEALQP